MKKLFSWLLCFFLPFLLRGQQDSLRQNRVPSISCTVPDVLGRGYWGTIGFGGSFLTTTRLSDRRWAPDASAIMTLGLGNPEKILGIDVRWNVYGISNKVGREQNFGESSFDLHLSRMINEKFWLGLGGYDLVGIGTFPPNDLRSYYASFTKVFSLKKESLGAFSTLWLTAGIGNGRFRLDKDYTLKKTGPLSIFASIAIQVLPEGNVVVEWNGHSLYTGISVFPLKKLPFQVTIGYDDWFHQQHRFVIASSFGFHLKKKGGNWQFKNLFLPAPPPPQSSRV